MKKIYILLIAVLVTGCATLFSMSTNEVRTTFSDQTITDRYRNKFFLKNDGSLIFYSTVTKKFDVGSWVIKKGEICFNLKSYSCWKQIRIKGSKVFYTGYGKYEREASLASGDAQNLQSKLVAYKKREAEKKRIAIQKELERKEIEQQKELERKRILEEERQKREDMITKQKALDKKRKIAERKEYERNVKKLLESCNGVRILGKKYGCEGGWGGCSDSVGNVTANVRVKNTRNEAMQVYFEKERSSGKWVGAKSMTVRANDISEGEVAYGGYFTDVRISYCE